MTCEECGVMSDYYHQYGFIAEESVIDERVIEDVQVVEEEPPSFFIDAREVSLF